MFQMVSQSVVTVLAFSADDPQRSKPSAFGSGVVIGPGRVITNCHVLAAAALADPQTRVPPIAIKAGKARTLRTARLTSADAQRDLCVLVAEDLAAPPVTLGATRGLRTGQRVYAIGSPQGLELSLSSGVISSLRATGDSPLIQTDASLSPGSSGGGLFDEQGRLIGITTFGLRGGQSLNFALPVEWVRDASARGLSAGEFGAVVDKLRAGAKAPPSAAPAARAGAVWSPVARSPQGYDVYVDVARATRAGSNVRVWLMHSFPPTAPVSEFGSRLVHAEIECATARWTMHHLSTYREALATGARVASNDFSPTAADFQPMQPDGVMDKVRTLVCR